jgi:hypothetical protein
MMPTKRTNLMMVVCVVLGILLSVLGCAGINMTTPQSGNDFQHSKRNVNITIDLSQRQQFFDQMRKFADKHGFTILIDTRSSGPEYFHIEMTRRDIEIIGDNAFTQEEYRFGFYDADRQHPVSESAFDDLVNDLKSFISEVPDSTFSVK